MKYLTEMPDGALNFEAFQREVLDGTRRFYSVKSNNVVGELAIGLHETEGIIDEDNLNLNPSYNEKLRISFKSETFYIGTFLYEDELTSFKYSMSAVDYNLVLNDYNDTFLFADLGKAVAYAMVDEQKELRELCVKGSKRVEDENNETVLRWIKKLEATVDNVREGFKTLAGTI